jgi:HK97 gp10 family phage protein
MMARKSSINGVSQLRRKLGRMPKSIIDDVRLAIANAGSLVYNDAESNVPVDEGDLRDAMKMQIRGDELSVKIGFWKKGNIKNWRKAGWRSHFAEFGTKEVKARPFLGPAYNKYHKRIKYNIDRAVNKALKSVSSGNFS